MAVTFKQLRDNAYRDVFLDTKVHAETVLFIRNLGREEDLQGRDEAIIAARAAGSNIVVSVSEDVEEPDLFDNDQTLTRTEEIVIQCCRDPAAVNSDLELLGGIADPNVRDGILRSVLRDPEQRPYYFQRTMRNPSDVLWRLVFSRFIAGIRGVPG